MKYGKKRSARRWGARLVQIYAVATAILAAILLLSVMLTLFHLIPFRGLAWITAGSLLAFAILAAVLAICSRVLAEPLKGGLHAKPAVNEPMPKGFCRFKKKIYRATLVRTLLCVLAAGLGASAAYLAVVKWQDLTLQVGYCIAIGFCAAFLALGVALLIQRPSERGVAETLDRRLAMRERVQTMLEFRNSKQAMATLQREDADERLMRTPNKQFRQHSVWVCLVAFVLSAAMLTGAFLIPTTAEESVKKEQGGETGPVEPPFSMSEWQITAMENLIAEVRASRMEETPKAALVAELETLLESLRATDTVASMKSQVIAVILRAEDIVDDANTHDDIYGKMRMSREEAVQMLADTLKDLKDAELRAKLDEIRGTFTESGGAIALSSFSSEVQRCLVNAGVDETDALGVALNALASDVYAISTTWSELWSDELEKAFSACYFAMSDALAQQLENSSVAQIVRLRLLEIFGIDASEIPKREDPDLAFVEEEDENDKENTESDGAPGKGDILYGSRDVIYHPDDNTHVEYGSVFNEYFAKKEEQLRDDSYSDVIKEAINKYFETLYGAGVEKSTDEEN